MDHWTLDDVGAWLAAHPDVYVTLHQPIGRVVVCCLGYYPDDALVETEADDAMRAVQAACLTWDEEEG